MSTIFSTTFPDEIKMPVQNIRSLIDSHHELQKTGIIRLGYASEKQLCFLYKRGELINTYLVTPNKWESLTPEQGIEWMLAAGDAHTKVFSISPLGLLMTKLLIQARSETSAVFVRQTLLTEYLTSAKNKPEAALVYLAWKNAAGTVFFTPNNDPHFNFISQDIVLDETGNYKVFYEWNEPECTVKLFTPDLSTEAWQEYYLRSAFANICERILDRFETITGRALVDSLVRLIAVFASRQNLDISITTRKLIDNEIFASPQDAAQNYRLLLAEMFEHFSAVIGSRLHASTLRDIIKSLPEREYQIIQSFEFLPKGYFYE